MEVNYVLVNDLGERYVEVPVAAYTKHYFLKSTKSKDGYIRTRLDGMLGVMLELGAEKVPYRRRTRRRKPAGCKVKVVMTHALHHGAITEDRLKKVGVLMDKMFRTIFVNYVRGAVMTGCSDNYAVVCFLDDWQIKEDVWNQDAAKMAYRKYMNTAPGYEVRNSRRRAR